MTDPTPDPRCGTASGAARHASRGETLCPPCLDARQRARAERQQRHAAEEVAPTNLGALVDPRFLSSYPAACAGDWDLFDPRREFEPPDEYRDRAALARKVCNYCPILTDCAEVVHTKLTVRDRAGFTYAGVTYNTAGEPIKTTTTTKDTAA